MLMAIDVGNTNMVFGLLEGEKLVGSFRLMTDTNRTSDEIGLTVCEYFRRFNWTTDQVCDIIIASVVPQVMYTLTSAIVKYFGKKPIIIDDDVSPGIEYDSESHLGADRSVSCVAAMEKYGKPLVVLDFGTATTVDALSDTGRYLGGCILAGIRVSTDALFQQAAMLPQVELVCPDSVLGLNTIAQIQAVRLSSTLAMGCSSAATELSLASVQSTVKLTEQMAFSSAPSASRISLTGISSSSR